jgi:putative transposase
MAEYIKRVYQVSVRRACSLIGIHRSFWYYESRRDDKEVEDKLSELAQQLPTKGFDEYYGRIRQEGLKWNHKRVRRVYRKMGLSLRRKYKKRLPARVKEPLVVPNRVNHTWSMDFMSDTLADGRKFRVLLIMDDFNREVLGVEAGLSFPAQRVVRTLGRLEEERGLPKKIRVDNGPEFIAKHFEDFCKDRVHIHYIQPGKPTQNAYIERLNREFRKDVLNAYWFEGLEQVNVLAEQWRQDYNQYHPHSSLGGLSPKTFLAQHRSASAEADLC